MSSDVNGAMQSSAVQGDTLLQSDLLEELTDAVRYRSWLVSLALPYLGDRPIEIGSGVGDYAEDFARHGVRITASEADPRRLDQLRSRFAGHPLVTVRELTVPIDEDGDYSAVVAYNVLEHIPDDVAAVRSFARLSRPGGAVVLFVPAFPIAMSDLDRRIGHQRRYRRADLRRVLEEAGLDVERLHYVNAVGLFAWIVGMRLLRMAPRSGPVLSTWDRFVIPAMRRVESRWRPPFGQSLLAVARVP